MQPLRTHRYLPWLMLAAFAFLSFAFKIGDYPLIDRDEALYSQVSRELLDHGDWWTLYWQDQPWFIHAPLAMWIQAAVFEVFGVSELTARIPTVLFGTGLVLLIGALGTVLFDRRTGLLAGLIAATSPLFYMIARLAILDMPFTFFITLSLLLFVLAWRNRNPWLYSLFWLSVGLATLGKGLWGMALPVMVAFLYAVTDKDRRRLLDWRIYASAVTWAAVVMPWIVIGAQRHGREFLDPILVTNTYARFTTYVCNHKGPWWFYLALILVGLFPWSILWPRAFFERHGDSARFLLIWLVPGLLLHSVARTKLPNYLLPFVPALAIMLASYICSSKRRQSQAVALPVVGCVLAAGIILGLRTMKDVPVHPNPYALGAYIIGAYSLAGFALARLRNVGPAIAAVCIMSVLWLIPFGCAASFPQLGPMYIAREARSVAGTGPVMTIQGTSCADGIYYYAGRPFVQARNMDELTRMTSDGGVIVIETADLPKLRRRGVQLRVVSRSHVWSLVRPVGGGADEP